MACEMKVGDGVLTVDLIPLVLNYFDVILGMDWLSANQATIDCEQKIVKFKSTEQNELEFRGTGVVAPPYLVSIIRAGKLLKRGCQGFLCSIIDTRVTGPEIKDISVVREYPDVFPEELPEALTEREIEFTIEVASESQPVSKEPYRMAPVELKELKIQLQDLLDKGFI